MTKCHNLHTFQSISCLFKELQNIGFLIFHRTKTMVDGALVSGLTVAAIVRSQFS